MVMGVSNYPKSIDKLNTFAKMLNTFAKISEG